MIICTADWLLPVTSPPVARGAVAVADGVVAAAGPREAVIERFGRDAQEVRELGRAVVLPGLVNAHTHIELSWTGEAGLPRGDYTTWLRRLLELRAAEDLARAQASAEKAVKLMEARGTVAVGDVANAVWIGPILARSGLAGVVFHEMYGARAADAERLMAEAAPRLASLARDLRAPSGRWRVAPSPHAPHTTSEPLLRALAGRAAAAHDPLSVHVAESEAELQLLRDGAGPLAALFRERGFADGDASPPRTSPVGLLDRLGALSPRTLAVHCVHLTREDHSRLQSRGVSVVTCPRSNEALGVGRAPVPALLAAGIPVALGTDSLASSPDLDLFGEMAALRREHPRLPAAAVVRMATLNGAVALGLGDRLGSIEPGKLARLVVVPLAATENDPWAAVCSRPSDAWRLDEAPREGA
jgi:cytosine/adenosine deaminase-related metal-dependent hydrolase